MRTRLLLLLFLAFPGCILVNRGIQSGGTIIFAGIGFVVLIMGIRFLMTRLLVAPQPDQKHRPGPILRFLTALVVSVAILIA
ncbi:MAG: hypothetical protein H7A21_03645 [Spirochaetales bacterium]|nr:hypothetical protein [Leptospiraceae bacterium]MCP5480504.1 hypothetical protein [Spirochaetales bacterium]